MTKYRFEFKYLIDPVAARRAERFIQSVGLKPDTNAQAGEYTVTSLYFDTPPKSDYYDKSGGFLHRTKVRARIYAPRITENTNEIWLEAKERFDALTRKTRIRLGRSDFEKLLKAGAPSFFQSLSGHEYRQEGEAILSKIIMGCRKPLLLVKYQRRPYVGFYAGELLRITFDSGLQTCAKPDLWYPFSWVPIEQNMVIMEVKFVKNLPAWFGTLIKFLELERISISKYGRAMEALRSFHPMPR
ncbi:MAG: polyphosphate polymerase domain-containing protein [Candidatus Sungiibacteriota bacterium]|uniref:Polyphosphate polymerase domain-containing protein n=1 Tax=Candidatus Sungiibacteriota bacterium TaxID=2750080 RepID=A0A7T5RJU0_9BACT|nr:MAG: polyphosphate polymerase domain-containing protein [Candidatus Sungbacteria bacterium]